ncbi:hypothetical protein J6590_015817 [Homalodisca vitripennis]|nr:hypothetical protein J6590_015817 [Homalodisca vitripennis]
MSTPLTCARYGFVWPLRMRKDAAARRSTVKRIRLRKLLEVASSDRLSTRPLMPRSTQSAEKVKSFKVQSAQVYCGQTVPQMSTFALIEEYNRMEVRMLGQSDTSGHMRGTERLKRV